VITDILADLYPWISYYSFQNLFVGLKGSESLTIGLHFAVTTQI